MHRFSCRLSCCQSARWMKDFFVGSQHDRLDAYLLVVNTSDEELSWLQSARPTRCFIVGNQHARWKTSLLLVNTPDKQLYSWLSARQTRCFLVGNQHARWKTSLLVVNSPNEQLSCWQSTRRTRYFSCSQSARWMKDFLVNSRHVRRTAFGRQSASQAKSLYLSPSHPQTVNIYLYYHTYRTKWFYPLLLCTDQFPLKFTIKVWGSELRNILLSIRVMISWSQTISCNES